MINMLNQEATEVLIRRGAALVKASISGSDAYSALYEPMLRLHPLCGYMRELYDDGSAFWLGDTVVTWAQINDIRAKIQSFNDNIDIDLAGLPTGGTPETQVTPSTNIVYRAGIVNSLPGVVTVQFMIDGVLAPMPNTDYILHVWNAASNGAMQMNVGTITKTVNGFTANDVLSPGQLNYEAILLT